MTISPPSAEPTAMGISELVSTSEEHSDIPTTKTLINVNGLIVGVLRPRSTQKCLER